MNRSRALLGAVLAVLVLSVFVGARLLAEGDEATYAGSKTCKKCHLREYKSWESRGHGKAYEAVKDEDPARVDEETKKACLACHTTGFGRASGFETIEKSPGLAAVGCETCHGAGSLHAAMSLDEKKVLAETGGDLRIGKADPGACVECHHPHIHFGKKYGK